MKKISKIIFFLSAFILIRQTYSVIENEICPLRSGKRNKKVTSLESQMITNKKKRKFNKSLPLIKYLFCKKYENAFSANLTESESVEIIHNLIDIQAYSTLQSFAKNLEKNHLMLSNFCKGISGILGEDLKSYLLKIYFHENDKQKLTKEELAECYFCAGIDFAKKSINDIAYEYFKKAAKLNAFGHHIKYFADFCENSYKSCDFIKIYKMASEKFKEENNLEKSIFCELLSKKYLITSDINNTNKSKTMSSFENEIIIFIYDLMSKKNYKTLNKLGEKIEDIFPSIALEIYESCIKCAKIKRAACNFLELKKNDLNDLSKEKIAKLYSMSGDFWLELEENEYAYYYYKKAAEFKLSGKFMEYFAMFCKSNRLFSEAMKWYKEASVFYKNKKLENKAKMCEKFYIDIKLTHFCKETKQ